MRIRSILCSAALVLCIGAQAQDLRVHVDKKGKVGYVDQSDNVVIKCQYETAQPFKDGVAIVTKSGKSGIIDASGAVVLPLKYTQISSWNDELYLIKSGKKMGLATRQGKVVQPAKYSHISKPNCYGRALVAVGGKAMKDESKTYMGNAKYGVIDNHGDMMIEPKYKGLFEFAYDGAGIKSYHEGKRLRFSLHHTVDTLETDCSYMGFGKWGISIYKSGILDGRGNMLLKNGLYDFVMKPKSDMVRYYDLKRKETVCGYHNLETGKNFVVATFNSKLDDINFWTHGDFIGDIAPVNGNSWRLIDKEGNTLRSGYSSLNHGQRSGLWAAKNSNAKWDVFTDQNADVAALSGYDDILFTLSEDDQEVFSVKKEGKYGCINRAGETLIPFEYEQALANKYDMVAAKKDGKWGLLTLDNQTLIPFDYANINLPSERKQEHFWVIKSDSLYYHYNLATQQESTTGYKVGLNFKDGVALVLPVNITIPDIPVNRAQLYAPNTATATIAGADWSSIKGKYGYLLNTDDTYLMDLPVSTMYVDAVIKEAKQLGKQQLTDMEKKNIMLKVTRNNRSYDMKSTIADDEWNY